MSNFYLFIYEKCKKNGSLDGGIKELTDYLSGIGLKSFQVDEISIPVFSQKLIGFVINAPKGRAFFPKNLTQALHNGGLHDLKIFFHDFELVLPPYYTLGSLDLFMKYVLGFKNTERDQFNRCLISMYSKDTIASFCTEIYNKQAAIIPFYPRILDSIKAYWAGLYYPAITALLPCIEGIIRNISKKINHPIDEVVQASAFIQALERIQLHYIKKSIFKGYDWYPENEFDITLFNKFDELVQFIESIKDIIKNSLFQKTSDYTKSSQLNRHGILHAFFSNFDSPENYIRLITLLNSLTIAAGLAGDVVTCFHPPETPASKKLAEIFQSITKIETEQ